MTSLSYEQPASTDNTMWHVALVAPISTTQPCTEAETNKIHYWSLVRRSNKCIKPEPVVV